MKYKVKIIETLEKEVVIEAANEHEAYEKANKKWIMGVIALTSPDDLTDKEIYVCPDNK